MDQKKWDQINRIVDTALNLDEKKRQDYLDEECKGDPELKTYIANLLKSIEQSDTENFLENFEDYPKSLLAELPEKSDSPREKPALIGKTISHYKIISLIGHGGMGSVYLAERDDGTYNKQVALKVMRRGMDTPSNIARFKRERYVLANLDHPNIARLLDGGVTEDGLPYLIMEYVDGISLYEYCDNNRLSIQERLTLFKSICGAVQHAHKNAIIHRDLKPSNILVTDEKQIKILDFGIAKLLEPEDPEQTLYQTQTGARLLTPGYAAPEQVEAGNITITTDTYTLGILLYELLTGAHPLHLEDKKLDEVEQAIRKQIPLAPSERVEALPLEKSEKAAFHRSTDPSSLKELLQGDLDAIVMKTLRKEPEKRYDTVEQLLEDLHRRENDLPIIAREDTFRYKTSRFIKRHKTGISVIAGFLILVIGFTSFYTLQIAQERNRAQQAARKAEAVTAFMTDLLGKSNPYLGKKNVGLDVTLGSILKYGQQKIGREFQNQPVVRAKLYTLVGEVYSQLGEFSRAESLLTKAHDIHKKLQKGKIEQAKTTKMLAFMHQDRGNYDKAEQLLNEAITTFKQSKKGLLQESAASSIARLGNLNWFNKGNFMKADSLLTKALQIEKQLHAGTHVHIATRYNDLANIYQGRGLLQQATPHYKKAIRQYRQLTGEHANLAILLSNYAALLLSKGDYRQALKVQKQALAMQQEITGPKSIDVALGTARLGFIAHHRGHYRKADSLLNRSLNLLHNIYGDSHPYIARVNLGLGALARAQNNLQRAKQLLEDAQTQYSRVFPPDHPRMADPLRELGLLYLKQGNTAEAGRLLSRALDICTSAFPAKSWNVAQMQSIYGEFLLLKQDWSKAKDLLLAAYETSIKQRGKTDPFTKNIRKNLVQLYSQWGKPDLAKQYQS